MSKISEILENVDTDDISFVITLGSSLIAEGVSIIQSLTSSRSYSVSELIDLANESVTAREEAQKTAHEYIKAKLAETSE